MNKRNEGAAARAADSADKSMAAQRGKGALAMTAPQGLPGQAKPAAASAAGGRGALAASSGQQARGAANGGRSQAPKHIVKTSDTENAAAAAAAAAARRVASRKMEEKGVGGKVAQAQGVGVVLSSF